VADDRSAARQVSVPLHLVNTFLLTAAITYTLWLIEGFASPRLRETPRWTRALLGLMGVLLVVAATGATTSLADTLFAAESLAEGIRQDFDLEQMDTEQLRKLQRQVEAELDARSFENNLRRELETHMRRYQNAGTRTVMGPTRGSRRRRLQESGIIE